MSDAIVGYYWTSESGHRSAFYCLTHRPTPPDDGEPVYECDATDEVCEDCGKRLCPSYARSAPHDRNPDLTIWVERLKRWWRNWKRRNWCDEDVSASIERAERPQYAMCFPCYFTRPLDGHAWPDCGVYITGSSDAAIADRLIRASTEVCR